MIGMVEIDGLFYFENPLRAGCRENSLNLPRFFSCRYQTKFDVFRFLEFYVEIILYLFSELSAADDNISRDDGNSLGDDIDVHFRRADIDQGDIFILSIVVFEAVLQGETVDNYRIKVDGPQHLEIIVNDLLFGRHEHDIGAVRPFGIGLQILEIEVDIFNVEWNILFSFGHDVFFKLSILHDRQIHFLDDNGITGD